MSIEKTMNTRIVLKNDTLKALNESTFIPKKGEVLLASVDVAQHNGQVVPTYLIKVGDGVNTFSQLNYAAAQAADVYNWAKQSGLTVVDNGTGKFVTDVVWDSTTDTIVLSRSNVVAADIADAPWLLPDTQSKDYGIIQANSGWVEAKNAHDSVKIQGSPNSAIKTSAAEGTGTLIGIILNLDNTSKTTELSQSASGLKAEAKISKESGNVLEAKNDGLYVPAPEEVSLPGIDNKDNAATTPAEDSVSVVSNGSLSMTDGKYTLTEDFVNVPTKAYVDKTFQPVGNYKTQQDAVNSDNTEVSGSSTTFISGISQNTNGEITVVRSAITAEDLGLSNAMHFIGAFDSEPTTRKDGTALQAGDVYVNVSTHKEYVYEISEDSEGTTQRWIELGDEGSHALKTITITGTDGLTGGGSLEQNRSIGLSEATKASLAKADNAKQKQLAVENKITAAAHVVSSLSQNENGDISYEVKSLTPADIGAQPAGDYALKNEVPGIKVNNAVNADKLGGTDAAEYALKSDLPNASQYGVLSLSGSEGIAIEGDAPQFPTIKIADSGVTSAKIADSGVTSAKVAAHAISAHHTKACEDYSGEDAEVWVFDCGSATKNIG